jgi:hypothetical protein
MDAFDGELGNAITSARDSDEHLNGNHGGSETLPTGITLYSSCWVCNTCAVIMYQKYGCVQTWSYIYYLQCNQIAWLSKADVGKGQFFCTIAARCTTFQEIFIPLQLVLLRTARDLRELSLRDSRQEPLQTTKDLSHALCIHDLALRLANESLDLGQGVTDQVVAKLVIDLLEHKAQELLLLVGLSVEDLVDEAALNEFLRSDALGHDKSLIGFGDAHPLHEAPARATFGNETQAGEWSEDECVRGGVDEVGEADQSRGETDSRTVEGGHEDLGVSVEGLGDVEVVCHEGLEPLLVRVHALLGCT